MQKIFNQTVADRTWKQIERITDHDKARLILGMQSWFNIQYTITVFYYINRPDKENHTYNLEYMQRKHLTKLKIHS